MFCQDRDKRWRGAMPDWSIKIKRNPTPTPDTPAVFEPLDAHVSDDVNWNNTTQQWHQPWPADSSYKPLSVTPDSPQYLSDPIEPGQSSDSYALIMPQSVSALANIGTLYYCCKLHPGEHGQITVRAVPQAPPAPRPKD
jgi:plastocyanin